MENNQLYLIQLQRRLTQNIEELKSLNNRLRNEKIENTDLMQAIRLLDSANQDIKTQIRKFQ